MEDNGDRAAAVKAKEASAAPSAPSAVGPLEGRRQRALRSAASKHVPLPAIAVTIALVVLVYLAGQLLYILRQSILLVLVGGFLALVLNPLVVAVEKRLHRRGLAVVVVSLWAVAVFAGLAVLFGRPLVGGATHLANGLPAYLNKVEHSKGWIGQLARKYQLESWARANVTKLVTVAENLGKPALAVGKGALTVLFVIGTTFVLVVLFLLEGPKLKRGLLQVLPPQSSARYQRLGTEISRSLSGYVLGDFLTSIIAGVVVFVTLEVLSVPYPLIWAMWVALVDFLPSVGGALAGIPTVLFALTRSFTAAVITAAVFLVYQQVENRLLNPLIMSRTVKVNPLLVLVAILIGADLGNWLGGTFAAFVAALLAVPEAGVVQVVAREIWNATSPEQPQARSSNLPGDELSRQ
jgi:predicted PurR-regulated permease PerM